MRTLQLLVFCALAGTILPISAKEGKTMLPKPEAGYGGVRDGIRVFACDTDGDDKGVRVRYALKNDNSTGPKHKLGDANGSEEGCGDEQVTNADNPVVWYSVEAGKHPEKPDRGYQRNCKAGTAFCKLRK